MVDRARWRERRPSVAASADDLARMGPSGDAEADAMEGILVDGVRRILERLTPDQRDVMLLRIVGGLTLDQVASVVGRRAGAVKMLQARGLGAIRREIQRGAVTL